MNKILFFLATSIFFTGASATDIEHLLADLDDKLTDPVKYRAAIESGQERIRLCSLCHGKDGNSVREDVPNLAQQNARYLLTQFEYFGQGERKNSIMSQLAQNLSEEDRVNIALYYSNFKVKARSYSLTQTSIDQGRETYKLRCLSCHNNQGQGNELIPRISGQPRKYIIKTLLSYRDGSNSRPDSTMNNIGSTLSNHDIASVANFLSMSQ